MPDADVDLLDDAIVADPYPLYARLRRERPVCPLKGGGYLLTRHEDVVAALANPALRNGPSRFSVLHASKSERYEASRIANNILPFQDAPHHTANRRRVHEAFGPCFRHVVDQLPRLADDALAAAGNRGDFDVVADYGRPFSVATMARVLGFDRDEADELAFGADAFFRLFAPVTDRADFAATECSLTSTRAAFRRAVDRQRVDQPECFASRLLDDRGKGEAADVDMAVDTAILLFADGIENVQFAIGMVWATLAEHAGLIGRVAEDDGTLKSVVREVLRIESPAQSIPRIADQDMRLHGTVIKRDTPVHLSLGSANRDETVFPDPDRIVIDEDANRSHAIPFGTGRHSCIGGNLAIEMVAAAAMQLVLRGVSPVTSCRDLAFLPRFGHRWPERVIARVD